MLKFSVEIAILLLIEAEGTRSSKMHSHFPRAVFIRGRLFNVLREKRVKGRPRRSDSDEEAPGPPAESECLQSQKRPRFISESSKLLIKVPAHFNVSGFDLAFARSFVLVHRHLIAAAYPAEQAVVLDSNDVYFGRLTIHTPFLCSLV